MYAKIIRSLIISLWTGSKRARKILFSPVFFGRSRSSVPPGAIVFFPLHPNALYCGIAALVALKPEGQKEFPEGLAETEISTFFQAVQAHDFSTLHSRQRLDAEHYLGGRDHLMKLLALVNRLKTAASFQALFQNSQAQQALATVGQALAAFINAEEQAAAAAMGQLPAAVTEMIDRHLEILKDLQWALVHEVLGNLPRIQALLGGNPEACALTTSCFGIYRELNAVLNSLDRLEVRGRDSAGLSLMLALAPETYAGLKATLAERGLAEQLAARCQAAVLVNQGITVGQAEDTDGSPLVSLTFVYKVAAEVGHLGDNVAFLRDQISRDLVLQQALLCPVPRHTILTHTRWASVGAINQPNCHPVDGRIVSDVIGPGHAGTIHVCLNGDIDNYLGLKEQLASQGWCAQAEITTDTKVIAMLIGHLVARGVGIEEAFRLAVNQFQGSHAIAMHTDLAPGKLFLAQRGSGQAIFVGVGSDHFMATSEVYGFVEQTGAYLKVDGESIIEGPRGPVQGQIFVLDQARAGSLEGVHAVYYDGTPIDLSEKDIHRTPITSRDIDRQDYPHYFLKEISESPQSVERTLLNRWKYKPGTSDVYTVVLDEQVIPTRLNEALAGGRIRRIYFVGQGTAGVAAQVCADILRYYMDDARLQVSALKASEMSGFQLGDPQARNTLSDALIVAISQSGTTTDTNKTVDMVREQGAYTIGIVNRRDSDLTFKTDGVLYTSSGRDIEMSVASTKALYTQIVAGALLGLYLAQVRGRRDERFVSAEVGRLLALPNRMREVLALKERIAASAQRLAPSKLYWAAVGSGPNKASADEIRIKLSELCYKTISSDFVEDKKHIDLSSEPLIIVCAAGTRPTVIGDIIKDTAIFKAHKATPVVIADQGEERFAPYAEDVFHVPIVSEHLAPIINTLAGHLWGYYAALAINEGSALLHNFQRELQTHIADAAQGGLSIYEIVLERRFQEQFAHFYLELRQRIEAGQFPDFMVSTSELILLLKYLSGRLPVADFEIDFGQKGTARNMIDVFFTCVATAVNSLVRPVDAIKHQAKTVTVGTSRVAVDIERGVLFDAMAQAKFTVDHLTPKNVVVLKNIQPIIAAIEGSILYRIDGLNILGEPDEATRITIVRKDGDLAPLPSRVETDQRLKGTKRIIVRQGNVFIGKGRKDDRRLVVIPLIAESGQPTPVISHLLLLHIGFKESVSVELKRKALGGKYEHLKNIVQENNVPWDDSLLNLIPISDLFGFSAEKVGEAIVGLKSDSTSQDQN